MTKSLRVVTVIGTRPDTIKLAPVVYELNSRPGVKNILCSSGQHKEMLQQALQIFDLTPDLDLDGMVPGQSLESLTARLITLFAKTFDEVLPDCVVVHGDTTTAFCAALAAFYKQIPVIHVEAGLRTHNLLEPFPEEFNRQAIARIACLNLAPTPNAKRNLLEEGISEEKILVSGNTVIESLKLISERILTDEMLSNRVKSELEKHLDFDYKSERLVLITMHRRENVGNGIQEVCSSIAKIAATFPDTKFVFPVHLNPSVSKDVNDILSELENVYLVPPLAYAEFVALLSNSSLIITDSGGIQEEAVSLGKHALVTRRATERDEGVEGGLLEIVSTDGDQVFQSASKILLKPPADAIPTINPYGQGEISKFIVDSILSRKYF
jgi:UDP-N-acetylglucosamine 2-epimerase (non-hydrolysing)